MPINPVQKTQGFNGFYMVKEALKIFEIKFKQVLGIKTFL